MINKGSNHEKQRRQRVRKVEFKEVEEYGEVFIIKRCTACLEFKKLDEFQNSKHETLGKRSYCKICENLRQKNKINAPLIITEKVIDKKIEKMKLCTKCRETKKLDEFYDDKNKNYGKTSWCIECHGIQAKKYKSIPENKEKIRVRTQKYNQRRDIKKINQIKWHDFRAKGRGVPSTLTLEEKEDVFKIFDNKCALSGVSENLSIDHFIGIHINKVGNIKENIIPLSRSLNTSKHIQNPFEWFESKGKESGLCQNKFDKVVEYLANNFNMTVDSFREFVYECYEGKEKRKTPE